MSADGFSDGIRTNQLQIMIEIKAAFLNVQGSSAAANPSLLTAHHAGKS
jgi:hypothetical protein